MEATLYTIRKNFLIPLGLVVLLCFILLATVLFLQLPTAKIIILTTFLLPATIIFAESCMRKVHVGTDSIKVKKLFRTKNMNYADLTAVDTIKVKKRVFISLSSENDFVILSNSYDNFNQLINQLIEKLPENLINDETKQLAQDPPQKCSDIFSAWLAVAVLLLIIWAQLRGTF